MTRRAAGLTVNLDIGGTFTDCFIAADGRSAWGKAPTTPDDFSRGFLNALAEACKGLGIEVPMVLAEAAILRYATTVALNALLQRSQTRLGLITTRGHEDMIFIGNGRAWGDGLPVSELRRVAQAQMPESLIPRAMVVGVGERVDMFGKIIRPLRERDVLEALQYLVDRGVQSIIVSLLWSSANPEHERAIRRIIREEYPDVYLGNIPVLLSSEIVPKWREYTRTLTTVLTGYLHAEMTNQLLGIGDRLRNLGYKKPLQMVQNTGGVAKLTRTRAVDTFQSGPVAGIMGAAAQAKSLGIGNIVCTDMGGTSFDLGLVVQGAPRFYSVRPVIDRWAVDLPLLEVKSIGAGGGSIAWINTAFGNRLEVGPHSAGSIPGPACYGMGGTLPTVTDADVLLGHIDPDYFLGGRMKLEPERAREAIQRHVARKVNVSVEQAALSIKRVVDERMGVEIFKELVLKGHDPREFVLFAYGGAGPTHCCGYAEVLGIQQIFTFPESSVFCAYGASTMDVTHVYERTKPLVLFDPADGSHLEDLQAFEDTVAEMERDMKRDMEAEGLDLSQLQLTLELELRYGSSPVTQRIRSPELRLRDQGMVRQLYESFRQHLMELSLGVDLPEAPVRIETFILHGAVPMKHEPRAPSGGRQRKLRVAIPQARRPAIWDSDLEWLDTPVFFIHQLEEGSLIRGPAIGETPDTTYVIAPGWEVIVRQSGCCEWRHQTSARAGGSP